MKPRRISTISKLLFFCLAFLTFSCTGQNKYTDEKKVYTTNELDSIPSFPGGENYMIRYLNTNLKWVPNIDVYGNVYLSFIVNNDGTISDVNIIKGLCDACDKEAIRVIKGMPRWKPGKVKDNNVRTQMRIRVPFKIIDQE